MISLAIELSSERAGLALLEGNEVLGRRDWNQSRAPGQQVFVELSGLFQEAGVPASQVGLFIAGRGPGTFSGLRMALSAAMAFALPGDAEVYAVSSGAALAREVRDEQGASTPVAVVGDARRGCLWVGCFPDDPALVGAGDDRWQVVPLTDFPANTPADALCVSPHWPRVESLLARTVLEQRAWIRQPRYPDAAAVARIALARRAAGIASDPTQPLYLHPPIARPRDV